ncbi:hypothetical protein DDE82_007707 [Stemphylium lycopersici]|nr:hypothetical protein DDE82_007707 [Stemphylium lycopersici]
MSFDMLYRRSEELPETRSIKRLIDAYMRQLERDSAERIRKGWLFLCACKDPDYRSQAWRREFNPKDPRICGTVRFRGQLCARCFGKAKEQACPWLEQFDGDRLGFPCAFEDPRLRRPIDANWKVGPLDEHGRPDPSWEKDPRRDGRCERTRFRKQLCQKCFNRMCEIRSFGRYFDTEWGILRGSCGVWLRLSHQCHASHLATAPIPLRATTNLGPPKYVGQAWLPSLEPDRNGSTPKLQ